MNSLTARAAAWEAGGSYETVNGHRIFVRRSATNGPLVVLLHGYPTSSYDWREVLPALEATGASVLTLDFLGFGLSDKPADNRYSLKDQADIVEHLINGRPSLLIAHDMGDSVGTELMARDIEGTLTFALNGVLLSNGSVIIEKATLTLVQKLLLGRLGPLIARLISEKAFKKQLAGVFSPAHPLTAEEGADQWSLLANNGGNKIINRLSSFNRERVVLARRWEGALEDWRGRLGIGWGEMDSVSGKPVLDAIIGLAPSAEVTRWSDLGHYPHIEDPAAVGGLAARFVDGQSGSEPRND
ncbi:alpha/beta fold hydrolase [Microbacterium sp. P04]|uniref:alpha/beta fold hydrolase n=1 Tax=Microbacterium sp. P04 TaxID=3366947 RepID=UPI0037462EC3